MEKDNKQTEDINQIEDVKPIEIAEILATIPILIFTFVSVGRVLGIPELMF